ncbi:unnamed protein product, partial [Closterium sp. NIES-53]
MQVRGLSSSSPCLPLSSLSPSPTFHHVPALPLPSPPPPHSGTEQRGAGTRRTATTPGGRRLWSLKATSKALSPSPPSPSPLWHRAAWCGHEAHRNHSLWEEACSPAHDAFGSQKISVRKKGKDPALWDIYIEEQPEPHNSQYCEVLGRQQRLWLQDELHDSNAPIKIIVSPSPLFTNPMPQPCSP